MLSSNNSNIYEYNPNIETFDNQNNIQSETQQPPPQQHNNMQMPQSGFSQTSYIPLKAPTPQLMNLDLINGQANNNNKTENNTYIFFKVFENYIRLIISIVLFVIIYVLFSLDIIKNSIGNITTIIYPDNEGYVSIIGCAFYGLIIGVVFMFVNYLMSVFLDKIF